MTAITATSISLSWSVVGGSVARSEVVWRETDRGTESSSGSLTGTSYTIDQLESTTIYTVTVRASNAAGIVTDSQIIMVSTGMRTSCSSNPAVIGGVVAAFMFLLFVAIIVIAVLVLRTRRRSYLVKGRYVKFTHFTAYNIMLCFIVQK